VTRPLLLDLFCCQGGAAMGYHRAGFDVIGVDIEPQPRYPFPMVVADALAPPFDLSMFDVIHASPPCQAYSVATLQHRDRHAYVDLVEPTRRMLAESGVPYIIENVVGAPLVNPIMVCGSGLGMVRIRRHRLFESNRALFGVPCVHGQNRDILSVVGHSEGSGKSGVGYLKADKETAMGIDWMSRDGLSEAIPPAYTEHIGRQLIDQLERAA
jgi:DNA (cytosine-5)-methyltransferase 1